MWPCRIQRASYSHAAQVHAMPEGPEKVAALAAHPAYLPGERAGDPKKDFARVNAAIDAARANGGAAVVHCLVR